MASGLLKMIRIINAGYCSGLRHWFKSEGACLRCVFIYVMLPSARAEHTVGNRSGILRHEKKAEILNSYR